MSDEPKFCDKTKNKIHANNEEKRGRVKSD